MSRTGTLGVDYNHEDNALSPSQKRLVYSHLSGSLPAATPETTVERCLPCDTLPHGSHAQKRAKVPMIARDTATQAIVIFPQSVPA
eukprot:3962679-Pleurochrysis_carterae.AAC.1